MWKMTEDHGNESAIYRILEDSFNLKVCTKLAMSRTVKIWFKISARYLKAVILSVQWNSGVSMSVNCMVEKKKGVASEQNTLETSERCQIFVIVCWYFQ